MMEKHMSSEGYKLLAIKYKQIEDNIERDQEIREELKQQFYNCLRLYNGVANFETYCNEAYFYKNQMLGSLVSLGKEQLGHVVAKNALVNMLSKKLTSKLPTSDIIKLFEDEIDIDGIKYFLGSLGIREHLMWSFRAWNFQPLLMSKKDLKDLPCVLGLAYPKGCVIEFLVFGHELPSSLDVRKPTFCDAGLNTYWRPGGFTSPLTRCSAKGKGKEELVHLPNNIENITTNIEKIIYEY